MLTPRPIDKSKPSNRRCYNCACWESAKLLPRSGPDAKERHCDTGDKDINYWNCCAYFRWRTDRTYLQDAPALKT